MTATNIRVLSLETRQANRKSVQTAMATNPLGYAANLRTLYEGSTEARRELVRLQGARSTTNKVARCGQLIAEHIYQCPSEWAAQAWHLLDYRQKDGIDTAVRRAFESLPALEK